MEHGFVGPLDIPAEAFHPDLQAVARIAREAREAGASGWSEIVLHLCQTTQPGDSQDILRAQIADVSAEPAHAPGKLEGSAAIVTQYDIARRRQHLLWKLNAENEQGRPIGGILKQIEGIETGVGKSNLATQLATRVFEFGNHPPKPIPILQIAGKALCTPGNLLNIQALPKAGKSAVVESMIAAVANGNRQGPDTLGFSAENPQGHALVHFDTEQSRYDHDALVRRALRRAMMETPPPWLVSYSVADLDIRDRRLALRHAMHESKEAHGGIFAVMIDGVADLCGDPNDSEESFDLVHELHALAITHDCAIITVLHENPGSESGKTRGHLGSQLERKAECNLRLAKDTAGITTIWAERARHCHLPKNEGPCFSWNDQASMHTSCGTSGEIKSAAMRGRLEADAVTAFGETESFRHVDLLEAVCSAFDLKERAAKDRVKKWAIEGVIQKDALGKYRLANP